MKKLCFAVVFSLLCFVNQVKADLHGDFLRIECNQDLGLLEIRSDYVRGDKIGNYFNQMKPFYKYSINTDGEDKSHAEMILINSLGNEELPYTYRCQLSDKQIYDVYVEFGDNGRCDTWGEAIFGVTIIKYSKGQKKLVEKVELGCNSQLKDIQLTDNNEGEEDITFLWKGGIAYFINNNFKLPLTIDNIKKKYNKPDYLKNYEEDEYGIWHLVE